MNLQCACLRLALPLTRPLSIVNAPAEVPPKAANDNQTVWPLVPFPSGWYAAN